MVTREADMAFKAFKITLGLTNQVHANKVKAANIIPIGT